MSDQSDKIYSLLKPFGLSLEESKIYLNLLEKGFRSALLISRELHLGRTRVYRILDILARKGLVEQRVDDMGMKFGATDPSRFKNLVSEKEHSVGALKDSLPSLLENLEKVSWQKHEKTKVLYYSGVEGLKQITYNSLRADRELLTYESVNDMSVFTTKEFGEQIRREFVKNKIYIKELCWIDTFKPYTNVPHFVDFWEPRYVSPDTLTMKTETLIYNDVYVIYKAIGDELFGVEIYNTDIAAMQRQLFHYVWEQAQKMKILDVHGSAVLI